MVGAPAHTPKPEAGSIANIRGNGDHYCPFSMRNADELAGSPECLPWRNDNGPVDIKLFPLLGTDPLKPWRTSSLQGMGKSLADSGSRKGNKELYGSQTEDKSPYMSLISDSACLSMAQRGEKELDQGPVAQEENGRQLKEKGKEEYRNHCEDPRTGEKEEIGSHNACNGSTGTYGWERGVPVGRKMDQRGSHTAQDIECEKTGWP